MGRRIFPALIVAAISVLVASASAQGLSGPATGEDSPDRSPSVPADGSAQAGVAPAAKKKGFPRTRRFAKTWSDKRDLTTKGDEPCQANSDPWDFKKLAIKLNRNVVKLRAEYFAPWVVGGNGSQEKTLDPNDPLDRSLESQALKDFSLGVVPHIKGKKPEWGDGVRGPVIGSTDNKSGTLEYGTFLRALWVDASGSLVRQLHLGKMKAGFAKKMFAYEVKFPLKKLVPAVSKPHKVRGLSIGVATNCRTAAGDYLPGGTWARFGGTEDFTIERYGKTDRAYVALRSKKG